MITRREYKNARRLMRDNGRYSLRWMPERVAQVFRALLAQAGDDLQEKARFLEPYGDRGLFGSGELGARWNYHAWKAAQATKTAATK